MDDIFYADEYYKKKRKEERSVGWWWPLVIIAGGTLLYYLVYLNDGWLPGVVTPEEVERDPYMFCSECSRQISRKFTALGPRIVGEPENEVLAPRMLLEELNKIKLLAAPNQIIEIQTQNGSGGFHLEYARTFINIYDGVQNVIVRMRGTDEKHSVLVNCHYDTVEISPGAGDDMISCAVMIDVFRAFASMPRRHMHDIVFLFNGAEETYFQGSHLFLQHEWAKACKIVVNMDACGTGGRNILFQSGPNNPWLLNYYASFAKHPHGQILGEELFQNGIIPSDSDFRIFRDFGDMPGLDFAFWRNGYVYHTPEDTEKYIPIESHQNLGDNLLNILDALADAPEINDMKAHAEGQMVYYDYLGWFMIYYTNTTSIVLNSVAIVLSFASIVLFIIRTIMSFHMVHHWSILKEMLFAILAIAVAIGMAIAVPVIIALIVDAAGTFVMVWYSHPMLIAAFYWLPAVAIYVLIPYLMDAWRSIKHEMSITTICQMYLIASQIPWIIVMIVLLSIGSRSAAILFFSVTSSAIANLIIHATPLYRRAYSWIWVYLIMHLPALAYSMYVVIMSYMFFIPIFGRSGTGNNDLAMSLITAFCVLYITSFALPLIIVVKKPGIIMAAMALVSFIMIIVALTTGLKEPYELSRPQRHYIMHTNRQFQNERFEMRREESGFFIYNLDRNSPRRLPVAEDALVSLEEDCKRELFCGLPLYGSGMIDMSKTSHWLPTGKPFIPIETKLEPKNETRNCDESKSTCEFTFLLKGPGRLTLTFAGRSGASLYNWTLPAKIVPTGDFNGQPAYLVHIVRTELVDKEITLNFNVSPAQLRGSPVLDIGLTGNFVHHKENHTEEFKTFLNNIPLGSSVEAWISAYRGYVF